MAVTVSLFEFDGQLGLDLRLDEQRERVRADPPSPLRSTSPWIFEWDAKELDKRDEHEFLGLFTHRLADVTDADIAELDALRLPRVDYPQAGLQDVPISDVVRWARARLLAGSVEPRSA
jgi:hypothetical protein